MTLSLVALVFSLISITCSLLSCHWAKQAESSRQEVTRAVGKPFPNHPPPPPKPAKGQGRPR